MVWKMFFEEFHDGCLMLSRLWYHNGMILAFCVTYLLAAPIKFLLKRIYGLEDDDVRIIPRWLFSAWPSSMCGWVDCSYSESLCCLTHPTMFMLNRIYGMEEMLFKEQIMPVKFLTIVDFWVEWCYLFESPCCTMPPIKFLLKRKYVLEEVVWKFPRRLFTAWSSLVSEWNERSISKSLSLPDPSNQVSAYEDIWFRGRCCLTNFKMSIQWIAIFDI